MAVEDGFSTLVQRWAEEYRAEAEADGYNEWMDDLEHLDDPVEAGRERVEQVVVLLDTIALYQRADSPEDPSRIEALLKKQTYRRADSAARYAVHFCGSPVDDAEVLVDRLNEIDLVDLFNHIGFVNVGVCLLKPDEKGIEEQEVKALEQAVLEDFHFDYIEDEISVVFERFEIGTVATVREL